MANVISMALATPIIIQSIFCSSTIVVSASQIKSDDCIFCEYNNSNDTRQATNGDVINIVSLSYNTHTTLNGENSMSVKNSEIYSKNLEKLSIMSDLEKDWDENGALPFSKNLIERVRKLLSVLEIHQPDIFPTYNGEIQLEYYAENDRFLKFVISDDENDECIVFATDDRDFDYYNSFRYDEDEIVQIVSDFYNNKLR